MTVSNPVLQEDLAYIHARVGKLDRFKGATIVVTGCAGFLGYLFMQYFVGYARELGVCKVIGLDTFLLGKPEWLTALAAIHSTILDLHMFDISKDRIDDIEIGRA